ncbi:MAG: hypothetical protein A2Y10_15375 [Planctomycetes bacterium GWF2_41_51]|nr:MAG: hypothetical protein A2Y10_15375 [Planctomycetes bacterium GWF2_41_51]HBG26982.1 transcriptional regulator [Phycisphaerales bacterium]
MGNLLTAEDMAIWLKVKPETILKWARTGRIPFLRFSGKVVRFDVVAVQQALADLAAKGGDNE